MAEKLYAVTPDGRLVEVAEVVAIPEQPPQPAEPEPAPAPARHIGSVERLAIWWHKAKRGEDSEC
jgi:hypothetical protein